MIAAKSPQYIELLGANLMAKMPLTGDGIVEEDDDGKFIFNYLHFPENNIVLPNYYQSCEDFINEFINYCKEQIDISTKYKIIDKYFYLLRFSQEKLDNLLILQ